MDLMPDMHAWRVEHPEAHAIGEHPWGYQCVLYPHWVTMLLAGEWRWQAGLFLRLVYCTPGYAMSATHCFLRDIPLAVRLSISPRLYTTMPFGMIQPVMLRYTPTHEQSIGSALLYVEDDIGILLASLTLNLILEEGKTLSLCLPAQFIRVTLT